MDKPLSLDGNWKFIYDANDEGALKRYHLPELDRSDWIDQAVPGFWPDGSYDGFGWYSRTFQIGPMAAGYKLAVVFESVDDNAVVWLDGRRVGEHIGYGQKFFIDISNRVYIDSLHTLTVRIDDSGGPGGINQSVALVPFIFEEDLVRTPASYEIMPASAEWIQDATLYEIFVRQHTKEGTFKALEADLPRIKALGIDILWLIPIHPIGEIHRKGSKGSPYSVKDYYGISPDLGNLDDFKSLVQTAHSLDMKLILDFVMNHSAWDNQLIVDHKDWYSQDADGNVVSPNDDWSDVADFNYDVPELQSYMKTMLRWWVQETDIDGFRFDVAELVPNTFWSEAKAECQKIKSDIFFLAEGAKPDLHLSGHDMTYSWNIWEVLMEITSNNALVYEIKKSIDNEKFMYPKNSLRMRFTENHDKERSRHNFNDSNLNLTAWALAAMLPGNPLIYAGQERGDAHKPSLFEKDIVIWDKEPQLENEMAKILQLRRDVIHEEVEIFLEDNTKEILGLKRGEQIWMFNFSNNAFSFKAKGYNKILGGGFEASDDETLTLPANQFGVFK